MVGDTVGVVPESEIAPAKELASRKRSSKSSSRTTVNCVNDLNRIDPHFDFPELPPKPWNILYLLSGAVHPC